MHKYIDQRSPNGRPWAKGGPQRVHVWPHGEENRRKSINTLFKAQRMWIFFLSWQWTKIIILSLQMVEPAEKRQPQTPHQSDPNWADIYHKLQKCNFFWKLPVNFTRKLACQIGWTCKGSIKCNITLNLSIRPQTTIYTIFFLTSNFSPHDVLKKLGLKQILLMTLDLDISG